MMNMKKISLVLMTTLLLLAGNVCGQDGTDLRYAHVRVTATEGGEVCVLKRHYYNCGGGAAITPEQPAEADWRSVSEIDITNEILGEDECVGGTSDRPEILVFVRAKAGYRALQNPLSDNFGIYWKPDYYRDNLFAGEWSQMIWGINQGTDINDPIELNVLARFVQVDANGNDLLFRVRHDVVEGGTYSVQSISYSDTPTSNYTTTHTSGECITLTATPAAGYELVGWFSHRAKTYKDAGGDEVFDKDETAQDVFLGSGLRIDVYATEDEVLFPLFRSTDAESNAALFLANGQAFDKLDAAVLAAKSGNKEIVLIGSGTLSESAVLPADITLVIPCDEQHLAYKKHLEYSDAIQYGHAYRTLRLAPGVVLTANGGSICVGGKQTCMKASAASSTATVYGDYGLILLAAGSQLVVESGANLYAYGYISGDGEVSVMENAMVHEFFQIMDWRGGAYIQACLQSQFAEYAANLNKFSQAMQAFVTGEITYPQLMASLVYPNSGFEVNGQGQIVPKPFSANLTFPITQYYIQNIESRATFHHGAKEILLTSFNVNYGDVHFEPFAFIGVNEGLFRLDEGATLTKWYDCELDRQMYEINGNGSIENMHLNNDFLAMVMTVLNAPITGFNSELFNLPIAHNMSILIKAGSEVKVTSGLSMLPGTVLSVEQGATLIVGPYASIYVYDTQDWNTHNYAGKGDYMPLEYTYCAGLYAERENKPAEPEDATMDINGTMIVQQDTITWADIVENTDPALIEAIEDVLGAYDVDPTEYEQPSNGGIYTTQGGAEIISSEGTGSIIQEGPCGDAREVVHSEGSSGQSSAITVNPAQLKNEDGTYSNTLCDENSAYTNEGGKWTTSELTTTVRSAIDVDSVMPANYVGTEMVLWVTFNGTGMTEVASFTPQLNGEHFALPDSWQDEAIRDYSKMVIPVVYTRQNVAGTASATLTLSASNTNATATLKVTEVLGPEFTINPTEHNFGVVAPGASSAMQQIMITGKNDLANSATWSASISDAVNFTMMDLSATASMVIVTYNPKAVGSHAATLTIKATAANGSVTEHTAQLTGTCEAQLAVNTLAFALPTTFYNDDQNINILKDINNTNPVQLTLTPTDILTVNADYTLSATGNVGKVHVVAEQQANSTVQATRIETDINVVEHIVVVAPHVPVLVNSDDMFTRATLSSGDAVSYAAGVVTFAPNGSRVPNRTWTIQFTGVPDALSFTPSGDNTWVVEQSVDGETWTMLYAASTMQSGVPQSLSLLPTTRFVRISYGSLQPTTAATLSNVSISELRGVKPTPDFIYMPLSSSMSTKVQMTYANTDNALSLDVPNGFTVTPATLPATGADNYAETTVELTSTVTDPQSASLTIRENGTTARVIPIDVYQYPVTLPIRTNIDLQQRFHYATIAMQNVLWLSDRKYIRMQNVPAQTPRSFTMAFADVPTDMAFTYQPDRDDWIGGWTVEESADNQAWTKVQYKSEGKTISAALLPTTRFVRVTCVSDNQTAFVDITALTIDNKQLAVVNPTELSFRSSGTSLTQDVTLTVTNLPSLDVQVDNNHFTVTSDVDLNTLVGKNVYGTTTLHVTWNGESATDNGVLNILSGTQVMASVTLSAQLSGITASQAEHPGVFTGLAQGYTLSGNMEGKTSRELNLTATFDQNGMPMFDQLYLFGETKTSDGKSVVSQPTGAVGSNAVTPCFVYHRVGDSYVLAQTIDNVNTYSRIITGAISLNSSEAERLSIYISGFAPYASTGYTKDAEGVFQLRGGKNDQIDVYLQDAYIYSRHKTRSGCTATRENGSTYDEDYVRGSGAVLVFECSDGLNQDQPLQASIHTRGRNLLMSTHGCFYSSVAGLAYQVSSPVQIHLTNRDAAENKPSVVSLNFDDQWPVLMGEEVQYERTNGFLSLQKRANNAPSIDLGNRYSEVNFRGGQVELQNALVGSPNYKTTLAISYRSGRMAGIQLSYGIGTDDAGGTVNFYDGTTTVIPMKVPEEYRQYYLMDTLPNGEQSEMTSCLRCPEKTFVYGGSQCWLRACADVEAKGGAPSDGTSLLGQHIYTLQDGDYVDEQGLAHLDPSHFPAGIANKTTKQTLAEYYDQNGLPYYATNSVHPDAAQKLYFWIPNGFGDAKAEQDSDLKYWVAAMTKISAEYGSFGGEIGGPTTIGETEVDNLLYCVIDQNISDVIAAQDDYGHYTYEAPIKNPAGSDYLRIAPSYVGDELYNEVLDENDYTIKGHIYYICTAKADEWMTFTAPFDVKRIWVVETFDENVLRTMQAHGTEDDWDYLSQRDVILKEQARHNADFAGFFGVVMAMGSNTPFDKIFDSYLSWAKQEDINAGRWSGSGAYNLRGRKALQPFNGSNQSEANFYLYENSGAWSLKNDSTFMPKWSIPTNLKSYNALMPQSNVMRKGNVYSLLFPYSFGTDSMETKDSQMRQYWDYWSGKFLIFEGDGPQTISGTDTQNKRQAAINGTASSAVLSGNFSFADVTDVSNVHGSVYQYLPSIADEQFYLTDSLAPISRENAIVPTTAFLTTGLKKNPELGWPISIHITSGEITFVRLPEPPDPPQPPIEEGFDNLPTVGHSTMTVMAQYQDVTVSVSVPQQVQIYAADGQLCYTGYVTDQVTTALSSGVFLIRGEYEIIKLVLR